MSLIKRTELSAQLKQLEQAAKDGERIQIYLFFGERFLCREAADSLEEHLLSGSGGVVNTIDGDTEDSSKTLGQLMNFSLLPGTQIFRVTDSRLFHSKVVAATIWKKVIQTHDAKKDTACCRHLLSFLSIAELGADDQLHEISASQWDKLFAFAKPTENLEWTTDLLKNISLPKNKSNTVDIAGRYVEAFKKGVPPNNILLLTAEAVDKRKQLFTYIKKEGVVVDCSVSLLTNAAAQKGQKEILREMVLKTLAGFQKKIAPQALNSLFDRVGFHPVAVVMETEKLALYVDDRDTITMEDLDAMVGRTREDALYELTDAFGKRQGARTLVLLHRLLGQEVHSLAILATMRNYLRKLLILRSFQLRSNPSWQPSMNANQFQNTYLPALKECGEWSEVLKGHPYALFMSFSQAQKFSCTALQKMLTLLLKAEFRLKGSPLAADLVLEELFLTMLKLKRL